MHTDFKPEPQRITIIRARWHAAIVDRCVDAFIAQWAELGGSAANVTVLDVPGALEIPLQAKLAAGGADAVLGVAFVVDGGIYRHDFVAGAVLNGLVQAQLSTDTPILSAVLTPHNFQESPAHIEFFMNHFVIKGQEAAEAAMAILRLRPNSVAMTKRELSRAS